MVIFINDCCCLAPQDGLSLIKVQLFGALKFIASLEPGVWSLELSAPRLLPVASLPIPLRPNPCPGCSKVSARNCCRSPTPAVDDKKAEPGAAPSCGSRRRHRAEFLRPHS